MLAMLIEELGSETMVAHDGQAGLRAIGEFQPDIVLMDVGIWSNVRPETRAWSAMMPIDQ